MKVLPLGEKLTIAIDIDGTIADCSDVDFDRADVDRSELMKAKPINGALEAVRRLHDEGHTIVFYTSRHADSEEVTRKWLEEHGFPFHHIEMEKLVAHVYIDDRAINGCDWTNAMEELQKPDLPGKIARSEGKV
jgi:uncharacterized HAD superfamily protein